MQNYITINLCFQTYKNASQQQNHNVTFKTSDKNEHLYTACETLIQCLYITLLTCEKLPRSANYASSLQ